jgi:hypothetical protein
LAPLEDGLFLAGGQRPAAVYLADLSAGRIRRSLALDGHHHESVFAIAVVPDHLDDPPPRLFGS